MAIYEFGHFYDRKFERKGRTYFVVGDNYSEGHLNEKQFNDNIVDKNSTYCELTGIYSLYKNFKDPYFGIEHYRRWFSNCLGVPLKEKKVLRILKNNKIIVPLSNKFETSVFDNYSICHYQSDLIILRDLICEKYPEYRGAFLKVMSSKKLFCYNMIICNRDVFTSYHEWLFDLLFEFEKRIDIKNYDKYQQRIFGFLSERLLNVWLEKNIDSKDIVQKNVVFSDNGSISKKEQIVFFLKWIKNHF